MHHDILLAEIEDEDVHYKKTWSEGWFLVEPETFLSTHLPVRNGQIDCADQMVATPITDAVHWEARVYRTPMTTAFHVVPETHHLGVIKTQTNEVHLSFQCPHALEYNAILRHLDRQQDIPEHVMMYSMKNIIHIHMRLPAQGIFLLKVFGLPLYADEGVKNAKTMPLLYYSIQAGGLQNHESYPSGSEFWGPTSSFNDTGTKILDYHGPRLVTQDGKTCIKVLLPTAGWCPIIHSFFHINFSQKPLPNCIYGEKNGKMLAFHILCPKPGEYRFDLFLKTDAEHDQYDACASFLILCGSPTSSDDLFPSHWAIWGPNDAAGHFGLKVLDPICSTVNTIDGYCQIRLERERPLALWHELFTITDEEVESWPTDIYAEMTDNETIYNLHISKPGIYKFVINASEFGERDYKLVGVFLIKCKKAWAGLSYPMWKGTWGINKHYTWMRLMSDNQDRSTVPVINGKTSLTFHVPSDVELFHSLSLGHDPTMDLKDACVGGRGKDSVTYVFALPEKGYYKFGLKEKSVGYIATFMLYCDVTVNEEDAFEPYWTLYGVTQHFQEYSMKILEPKHSIIQAPGGKCTIQHKMGKIVPLFYQLLKRGEEIWQAVYAELKDKVVTYYFELPKTGSYRFSCWTQYEDGRNVELFSYMISAIDVKELEGYPKHNELWGITAFGKKHKVAAMHQESSTIKAKAGLAKLVLKTLTAVEIRPELINDKLTEEEGQRRVFTELDGGLRTISVAVPERGRYALRIWIKPTDAKEERIGALFLVTSDDYLVSAISFPTHNSFYDGCRLQEPRMEPLTSGMEYFFKMKIPLAKAVRLQSEDGMWTSELIKQGLDMFSGMVEIGDSTDIWVTAEYDGLAPDGTEEPKNLLKYTVQ